MPGIRRERCPSSFAFGVGPSLMRLCGFSHLPRFKSHSFSAILCLADMSEAMRVSCGECSKPKTISGKKLVSGRYSCVPLVSLLPESSWGRALQSAVFESAHFLAKRLGALILR